MSVYRTIGPLVKFATLFSNIFDPCLQIDRKVLDIAAYPVCSLTFEPRHEKT